MKPVFDMAPDAAREGVQMEYPLSNRIEQDSVVACQEKNDASCRLRAFRTVHQMPSRLFAGLET
jgi:hypothetical protein